MPKIFAMLLYNYLEEEKLHYQMIQNCRAIACAEYSLEIQVKRYS
ncbi:MAG: hypothetical protein QNJ41_04485 [Xenococcaceae cyanobacterium MO_188.B32]|nr:hypothetical protein [Xenococcaceae cyanobacterium MO_188.B32]